MRLSQRLIASLVVGVALVSALFAWHDVRTRGNQLRSDLIVRTAADARTLEQALAPLARDESVSRQVGTTIERLRTRTGLDAVVVFDRELQVVASTESLTESLQTRAAQLAARASDRHASEFLRSAGTDVLLYTERVLDAPPIGAVALVRDAGPISEEVAALWRARLTRMGIELLLVAVITTLLVRWSFIQPMTRTAKWLESLRLGRPHRSPATDSDFLKPLLNEVTHLVRSLQSARASAEEEARLRHAAEAIWTPERLRAHVRAHLQNTPLFVVSNREPYMHVRRGSDVSVVVPASGVVTALEPVLRACNGTWVAHGSGNADRERVDAHDRVRVPPSQPEYTLRRVWLSEEEEKGYYYGFSNEGLWPLCHIAHTRPLFREPDWAAYRSVNRKFADALVEEMADTPQPLVLVQDYHFALLPRLIKAQRPDARVGVFWHIPWPNPEAFGICPWQADLLEGLLGADLIGFHTQAHCNNFLETVDRAFESQIEWEQFTVRRHDHATMVRPFPISVAAASTVSTEPSVDLPSDALRTRLLKQAGVSADFMGIGVDRVDYTKGILERFRGLERFFEKWDRYLGQFTFVQIGAPSRTHVKRYQDLLEEVTAEAARINARFGTANWKPLVLLTRHHDHQEIDRYYQAADFCLVTSLHDGMNLVAKEFVTARADSDGVLILSQFDGAARELCDALIVNPYDTEQLADAMRLALEMDPDERRRRMVRMRQQVREYNVYRWAATLIGDLAAIRLGTTPRLTAGEGEPTAGRGRRLRSPDPPGETPA
jgi:trehalose 6-phosphate synthase